MKNDYFKKIFLATIILLSAFSIFANVKADCVTDDWYTCEGSYLAHYTIDSSCNTYSSTIYCDYGCSGTSCQSAPSQTPYYPSYTPSYTPYYTPSCSIGYLNNYQCSGNELMQLYQYSDCSNTWQNVQYCSYGCSYNQCNSASYNYGCYAQYLNNYQCWGNQVQQQYQYSDCSTAWQTIQTCPNGCSNGQCMGTTTVTTTVTAPQTCPIQNLGIYQCSGSMLQVQYRLSDCSIQWINQVNCGNGCSNGQCVTTSNQCVDQNLNSYQCSGNYQQVLHQNSDCTTVWQNVQYCSNGCSNNQCVSQNYYQQNYYPNYYLTGYQFLPYQYLSYPCSAGTTNKYQCSGNVRQVQYQNSNCLTSWQNVETCPNGCANGICTALSTSTSTVTVIQQPFYFSNLWIIVLIFAIIILFVIVVRLFVQDNPRRNYRNQSE